MSNHSEGVKYPEVEEMAEKNPVDSVLVEKRINQAIAYIDEVLSTAMEEKENTLRTLRINLESQVANVEGRLSQKIEDLNEQRKTLQGLLK